VNPSVVWKRETDDEPAQSEIRSVAARASMHLPMRINGPPG
jgi:hypothetical protein